MDPRETAPEPRDGWRPLSRAGPTFACRLVGISDVAVSPYTFVNSGCEKTDSAWVCLSSDMGRCPGLRALWRSVWSRPRLWWSSSPLPSSPVLHSECALRQCASTQLLVVANEDACREDYSTGPLAGKTSVVRRDMSRTPPAFCSAPWPVAPWLPRFISSLKVLGVCSPWAWITLAFPALSSPFTDGPELFDPLLHCALHVFLFDFSSLFFGRGMAVMVAMDGRLLMPGLCAPFTLYPRNKEQPRHRDNEHQRSPSLP